MEHQKNEVFVKSLRAKAISNVNLSDEMNRREKGAQNSAHEKKQGSWYFRQHV